MPAPLNTQPTGLLGFLGIKNGGEYPRELSPFLSGELDLLPLYEVSSGIDAGFVSGAIAGGVILFGPAGATTTPGDSWHIHAVHLYGNCTPAAAAAGVVLGVHYANGTFVGLTDFGYAAAGVGAEQFALLFRDIWLPPGASLAYQCYSIAGAPTFIAAWAATRYQY